jgi:hypothetical protein
MPLQRMNNTYLKWVWFHRKLSSSRTLRCLHTPASLFAIPYSITRFLNHAMKSREKNAIIQEMEREKQKENPPRKPWKNVRVKNRNRRIPARGRRRTHPSI